MGWPTAAITMSVGFTGIIALLPSYLQYPAGLTASGTGLVMILHPETTPAALAGPLLLLGTGFGLAAGIIDANAMNERPRSPTAT
jgi:hypothetical protein